VIIHIRVIDDGGAVVYTHAVAVRCIIAVYPRAGNVALRYEHPVVMRDSDMHVDAHTRTQGCPAIVATSAPPAHPRRTPLISGYPRPAVVVAVRPPAVMERCPAPIVVRYPSVPVARHHPMAIRSVRLETVFRIRKPYISVFGIVYPI